MLLHPTSNFKIVWQLVICCIVVQTAILTPVRVAFIDDDSTIEQIWLYSDLVYDVIFLVDIFLNFITIVELENGSQVCDRKEIAIIYLKSWFFVDLISSVPVNLILFGQLNDTAVSFKFIKLFKIITLYRLLTISKYLKLSY